MLLPLLPYHARLAARSLRRDPGLSATVVIVMGVASGIFCFAMMHYLRIYGPRPRLSADLHQVEILTDGPRTLELAFSGSSAEPSRMAVRSRVSFPDYRVLSTSGLPARQTATFRTRLLVGSIPADAATYRPHNARFVNADFFSLFRLPFRGGGPWSREQESQRRAGVVLSRKLNASLFAGRNSVGQEVMVNGRLFRIAGVLADDQPFTPEWDQAVAGSGQDAIYVPFSEHEQLRAWPMTAFFASPVGPHYSDLLASDALFVSYWLELTTPAARLAYGRYLEEKLGRKGIAYVLRDLATLRTAFPLPHSHISFYALLTLMILVGGGLIMTRLLLAKGLAHADELGIFRALGAPRRALFSRQIIEGAMLSGAAALLAVMLALPQAAFYNDAVGDTDIPLRMTGLVLTVTFTATIGVGILSSLYPAWRAGARRPTVSLGAR